MARRFVAARRGPKRQMDWSLGLASSAFVNVPANSKVLLGSTAIGALDAQTPFTIVRTRGTYSTRSDQSAATEDVIGGIGLAIVNDVSAAAGIGSIPGPLSDLLWNGWYWIDYFRQTFQFESAVGIDAKMSTSHVIDSKAMRKVTGDSVLVLVGENDHATSGLRIGFALRILTKAG